MDQCDLGAADQFSVADNSPGPPSAFGVSQMWAATLFSFEPHLWPCAVPNALMGGER